MDQSNRRTNRVEPLLRASIFTNDKNISGISH
jgi:hypothetical protein